MTSPTQEALAAAAARYQEGEASPTAPTLPATISREAVAALSAHLDEPAWLREQRLAAWERYEALPMPKMNRGIGDWWKVDISDVHLETLAPFVPAPADSDGDAVHRLPALSVQEEHAGLQDR